MIRKLSLLFVGAIVGALTVALTSGTLDIGGKAAAAGAGTYKQLNVFADIFDRVRSQYVSKPDEEELIHSAINGMLTSLDPHSSYMTSKEHTDMRVQTRGEFGGLGIEVTMENELVKVITPIDDTPASRAGVLAGDLITGIDGEPVRGLSLQDAVEKMRGPVNTPIVLTVQRATSDDPLEITIIRDVIKIRSVRHRIESGDVGYLRVTSFTQQTVDGLEKAIDKIKEEIGEEKLAGYVLDLRLNPGGLLEQAISVSDTFLDRGRIVSTRGRNPQETRSYRARAGDLTGGKPVIVLINGGSASASEIVAGALQDHRRSTVVGTRSFGKGSVQTIIPLGPSGALRLTTALYFTPSGRSIQAKGIDPDIKISQPLPDELKGRVESRGESQLRGHITGDEEDDSGSGSIAYVPPDPKDDLQLIYALDLLHGTKQHDAYPPDPSDIVRN